MSKKTETFTPYDSADYLTGIEDMAAYLEAAIDEAGDDPAFIAQALGTIARSGNVSALARRVGMSREGLYRARAAHAYSARQLADVAGASDGPECLGDERGIVAGLIDGGFQVRRHVLDAGQVVSAVVGSESLSLLAHRSSNPLLSASLPQCPSAGSTYPHRRAARSAVGLLAGSRPGSPCRSRSVAQRSRCRPVYVAGVTRGESVDSHLDSRSGPPILQFA